MSRRLKPYSPSRQRSLVSNSISFLPYLSIGLVERAHVFFPDSSWPKQQYVARHSKDPTCFVAIGRQVMGRNGGPERPADPDRSLAA